jgi:hypothetical protein
VLPAGDLAETHDGDAKQVSHGRPRATAHRPADAERRESQANADYQRHDLTLVAGAQARHVPL